MASQFLVFAALICACCAFTLPQGTIGERQISLEPAVNFVPTIHIVSQLPHLDQELQILEEAAYPEYMIPANRIKRQNGGRQPMPSGQHGQVEVYGEHRRREGTDLSIQGTGRIWESRDGRSTLDANANYQRHYGGPSGTGRPNYGGGINFNHRF